MGVFEDINLDDIPIMERLKHKYKLHKTVAPLWREISAESKAYPRGYSRFMIKSFMKDVKKGVKIINQKNPVFIEMPKLKAVGNGQVKEVRETLDNAEDDNILVYYPQEKLSNNDFSAIEDKR